MSDPWKKVLVQVKTTKSPILKLKSLNLVSSSMENKPSIQVDGFFSVGLKPFVDLC